MMRVDEILEKSTYIPHRTILHIHEQMVVIYGLHTQMLTEEECISKCVGTTI